MAVDAAVTLSRNGAVLEPDARRGVALRQHHHLTLELALVSAAAGCTKGDWCGWVGRDL
jgi:hypothetical protein